MPPLKRVFYVRYLADPVFSDILAQRSDVRLDRIDDDTQEDDAASIIAAAHAYQIGTVRSELEEKYHAAAPLLARAPSLLVVSTLGAGYDTVDVDACTRAGVIVVNQAGGNAESVAEHALGMMLCVSKRIIETDRAMRRAGKIKRLDFMGMEALGKTIGIVGLGHIGSRIAQLCEGLLQMRVLAYDPYLTAEQMTARRAKKVGLDELLQTADYVSVNCPLTDETRGMLGAREFGLMQKHTVFINTARGFIHDEQALAAALRERRIAGAGLDVWEQEPPPPDHPLLHLDNVLASPHTGGATHDSRRKIGTIGAEQLLGIFDGKPPPRLLNPDAWPVFVQRFEQVLGVALPAEARV